MPLSVKRVEHAKPGRYSDGGNLYLQVMPTGSKSWIFRYQYAGRSHDMGLGPTELVTLAEARDLALAARKQLLQDIDPLAARKAARARAANAEHVTFEAAAQQYFDLHSGKWRNQKHRAQFLSTLKTYAFPVLGSMGVDQITTADVLKVLEPIWAVKPETASRTRQRVERVLAYAIVRGWRLAPNPAAWVGHLREALPARSQLKRVKHHEAIPFKELPDFMKALRTREGFAAKALELCVLTATRTSEITGARWSEIDFADRSWSIPAERMKAAKPHKVPLSNAAVRLLKSLPRDGDSDFVFPGGTKNQPLSNMGMAMLLKRMGRDETVHGTARSAFSDWAHEVSHFPNHVIEMSLAHTIGNKVEASYRRGDLFNKRRELMDAWAAYCDGAA